MKKNSIISTLIDKSLTLRDEQKALKTNAKVKRYLAIEDRRKQIHKDIGKHIVQYNVNTDTLKGTGLVVSKATWVVVSEVNTAAENNPKVADILRNLIHSKPTYYTN
jgi:hypothetical protein